MDQSFASRADLTPHIDAERLNADIEATARFGGTANGGVFYDNVIRPRLIGIKVSKDF